MDMLIPPSLSSRLEKLVPQAERGEFLAKALEKALKERENSIKISASVPEKTPSLKVYIDGGSRGNPGLAGCGIVILGNDDVPLHESSAFLGVCTNNQAEYQGLLLAFRELEQFSPQKIEIYSDSELMVKQLRGEYKVRHPELQKLFLEAKQLEWKFPSISYHVIRREKNKRADELANEAMDRRK